VPKETIAFLSIFLTSYFQPFTGWEIIPHGTRVGVYPFAFFCPGIFTPSVEKNVPIKSTKRNRNVDFNLFGAELFLGLCSKNGIPKLKRLYPCNH